MASEEDEGEVVYEEEEVLWAKIRGYPWWPAFVDQVHPVVRGHQAEYTVFFFGDNTNSKLGASKLRKFCQHYIECYLKARSHRKLMSSIQMAEDKLAQNNQNVQIFETMRNSIKGKSKGRGLNKSESLKGEVQIAEGAVQLPNLVKFKTEEYVNTSRNLNVDDFQVKREATGDTTNDNSIRNANAAIILQSRANISDMINNKILPEGIEQENKIKKQEEDKQIIQQQPIVLQSQQMQQPSYSKMILQSQPIIQVQSQQNESLQKQSDSQIISNCKRKIIYKQKSHEQLSNKPLRKRGRPKKIYEAVEHSPSVKINPQRRIKRLKRRLIRKANNASAQMAIRSASLSPSNSHILQIIKKLRSNREGLIDYLSSIQITVDNVKQILDLDVSNILQDGVITQRISNLLQTMKAALLYKYFPDDVKHRKKYRQLSKKVLLLYDDAKNEPSQEEEASSNKSQQQQIRKKTIVKLQKFLKAHSQVSGQAKQMAVKIQAYFEQADSQIGQRYKTIAFKVLKTLKQKNDTCSQVIKKLDQQAYD